MPTSAVASRILADLAPAMKRSGAPWCVFGAQAVIAWTKPRVTGDVDVTALLSPEKLSAFVEDLRGSGFELRVKDVDDFVEHTHVLPLRHVGENVPVDIVLGGSGFERGFVGRAKLVSLAGKRFPFIDPSDLVVAKVLAGRPKDLEDLRSLIRHQRLDLPHVRALLSQLEEALSQSDLLPTFEALLHESKTR